MKAIEALEKIVPTIFVCTFVYAMVCLFLAFAEYVGKNGINAYNVANDEVMSLVAGEGNL
jgi:hypothetical protein